MADYSLVPVDHQPDFGGVSLVPVEHDPFDPDGAGGQPVPYGSTSPNSAGNQQIATAQSCRAAHRACLL